MAANKVIQKYQQSSCEQLWEQKGKPKTAQEQEMIQFLRNDPQMRDGIHQPDRRAGRQQDVRVRHDPMRVTGQAPRSDRSARGVMIRPRSPGWTLLVAFGVLLGAAGAGAQQAPPPATEKAAPSDTPALEPKAIEVLKASSARLAAARSMSFTAVVSYESPSRPARPSCTRRGPTSPCSGPTSCG